MALPVILINSATGSDTAASGAGPGTALTGSTGVSSGTGLTVDLSADAPDLTGVATDGSHVIYFADATAGNRNFGKITAANNGTKVVTVADAFGATLTKSWAIGGKRAALLTTTSGKLLENNSTNGDAMPGWIMRMESGHAETKSASINWRRAGDTTNGNITVEGVAGAATMPILTFSNNGDAFIGRTGAWTFQNFEMQNTNASHTASICFDVSTGSSFHCIYKNIRVNHSSNKFNNFLTAFGSSAWIVEDCTLRNFNGAAITINTFILSSRIINSDISLNGSGGVLISAGVGSIVFEGNTIAFNTGDGIHFNDTSTIIGLRITGNVIHGNSGDGIELAATAAHASLQPLLIENNEITFNGSGGGYGINFSGASWSDAVLQAVGGVIRNNAFYTNTSGKYNGITNASINEVTTDPSSGLGSSTKDYAGTTNGTNFMSSVHKALGYPIGDTLLVGGASGGASYNYQDIGLQHKDAGGGGLFTNNLNAGLL